MSRARDRRTAVRRRGPVFVLTVFVLSVAVMLMHTVMSGHVGSPASAGSLDAHEGRGHPTAHPDAAHHPGPAHRPGPESTTASMTSAPEMSAADDCGEHMHDCVFTRAAGVDLPAVILVLLVWALAVFPRVADTVRRRTTVLGRPPPWAMFSHLQLQVIRC